MIRANRGEAPSMAVMRPDEASAESPGGETIQGLFTALEAPLLNYALRLSGERGLAEDFVQEAFMKLHAQFEEVREPRRWLYRTVHNLALNQRRDSAKIIPLNPSGENGDPPATETTDPQPLPHAHRPYCHVRPHQSVPPATARSGALGNADRSRSSTDRSLIPCSANRNSCASPIWAYEAICSRTNSTSSSSARSATSSAAGDACNIRVRRRSCRAGSSRSALFNCPADASAVNTDRNVST